MKYVCSFAFPKVKNKAITVAHKKTKNEQKKSSGKC